MADPKLNLPQSEWSARSGRVPSLDGLRGISVAIVLIGHMLLPSSLVGVSALGLKLFFFISGFLITRLLLAENKATGQIDLIGFYIRRFLRLYPVIIVYVLTVTLVTLSRGQGFNLIDLASVFFYFVNYMVIHYEHLGQSMSLPVGVLWSLSVEEHFYLLAPLALVLVRGDARRMLAVALGICVISLSLRLIYAHTQPDIVETLELYWRSETRFDCIAYGVILACLTEIPSLSRLLVWLTTRQAFYFGCAIMLASYVVRDNYFQNTWRFSIQSLALLPLLAGVIFASEFVWLNRMLNSRFLTWMGALSYSLYVWHTGIMFLFGWALKTVPFFLMPVAEIVLASVMACISYYALEQPILGLRKRFTHRTKITAASRQPQPLVHPVVTSAGDNREKAVHPGLT